MYKYEKITVRTMNDLTEEIRDQGDPTPMICI